MTENMAKCLLVSKVLVADGMMAEGEHAFLDALMTRLALTPEERQKVTDLEGWDQAEAIVKKLSVDEKREIVEMLVDAASSDGNLSGIEMRTVKRVTAALELPT